MMLKHKLCIAVRFAKQLYFYCFTDEAARCLLIDHQSSTHHLYPVLQNTRTVYVVITLSSAPCTDCHVTSNLDNRPLLFHHHYVGRKQLFFSRVLRHCIVQPRYNSNGFRCNCCCVVTAGYWMRLFCGDNSLICGL